MQCVLEMLLQHVQLQIFYKLSDIEILAAVIIQLPLSTYRQSRE